MGISSSFITRATGHPAGPWIAVEPGLEFPRYAAVTVKDDPRVDFDLEMFLAFNANQRRYEVDELKVSRRSPLDQLTGTALRTIPVAELMRSLNWVARIAESGERMPAKLPPELVARLKREGPSSNETLMWVGRVYVAASAVAQSSGLAVQESFGIAAPTAAVWIRRARDRGFIPDISEKSLPMPDEDFAFTVQAREIG